MLRLNLERSSTAMIALATLLIPLLTMIRAPYGKHAARGYGPPIPARAAWLIMEIPNVIVPLLFFLSRHITPMPAIHSVANRSLLLFFLAHYTHRALIYPLIRMPSSSSSMPLMVMLSAFSFCTWNAWQQSTALLIVHEYAASWVWDVRFSCGFTLAIVGGALNIWADAVLLRLRMQHPGKYGIPRGGLFELVSCPNFLGENVEWFGWAVACWSRPAFAFAMFTFCNTAPRACSHHAYYRRTLKDYPSRRRALIPFVL